MDKLIIANWKMNPKTSKEAGELFLAIKEGIKSIKELEIVICPPFLWLKEFAKESYSIKIGGQNCHWEAGGAFTGEISAQMLSNAGADYVILGHSERRHFLGETDDIINSKIKAALKAKLRPILCVGENKGEEMHIVLETQLMGALKDLSINQIKNLVIAYEPVWAVFSDEASSPDSALSANLFIKKILTKLYSRFLADRTPVVYGGSVNAKNAVDYILKSQMQGLLVGGASLESAEFSKIIQNVSKA